MKEWWYCRQVNRGAGLTKYWTLLPHNFLCAHHQPPTSTQPSTEHNCCWRKIHENGAEKKVRNLASIIHHSSQLTAPGQDQYFINIFRFFLCEKVLNMQIGALQKTDERTNLPSFCVFSSSEKFSWAICSFQQQELNMFGSMFVWNFWHYQIAEFNISDPFLGSAPVSFHSLVPSSFYFRALFCDLNLAKRFKATTLVRFVLAIFKWMNVSVDSFKKGIRKRMSVNMMLKISVSQLLLTRIKSLTKWVWWLSSKVVFLSAASFYEDPFNGNINLLSPTQGLKNLIE